MRMLDPLRSAAGAVRRSPRAHLLGLLAFLAVAGYWSWLCLLGREPWRFMVDLSVYRDAGISVLIGRPVYQHLTGTPQLLPFTYPPFAALLMAPMGLLSLKVLAWLWTALQYLLLAVVTAVVFRPALQRFGRWRPLALGALVGLLAMLYPLREGALYGQINMVLVSLVLADYVVRAPRWPRGLLIGIATAIKLTPGIFIVHLWFAGRRREALTAAATAVGCTLAAFLVIPTDSADFWFRAMLDSERLGVNRGTSNQSVRGILLRFDLDHSVIALAVIGLIACYGIRYAVRCTRRGDDLAACAIVGLLAVLLSPVAWIHHLAWVVLVLAVALHSGRSRRRVVYAAGLALFFLLELPYWAIGMVGPDIGLPHWLAKVIENAFGLAAIGLIPLLDRWSAENVLGRSRRWRRPPADPIGLPPAKPVPEPATVAT